MARYVPPCIQVGWSSGRAHTNSSRPDWSSAVMLAVPSLNPNRLRGVGSPLAVTELLPKPIWDHLTVALPKAMRTRLRTACTATWASSAQAWMQMSPPLSAGSMASPGKCGRSVSVAGFWSAMPNRSTPFAVRNKVGPNPTVIVSPAAGRSRASPVSSGGAS